MGISAFGSGLSSCTRGSSLAKSTVSASADGVRGQGWYAMTSDQPSPVEPETRQRPDDRKGSLMESVERGSRGDLRRRAAGGWGDGSMLDGGAAARAVFDIAPADGAKLFRPGELDRGARG